jgi:hypothetical protein
MGMHHGYLVADLPWPTLFAILQQRTGRFADRGPIDSIDAMPAQSTDEGWWLAAGEYAGRAYVLDPSWLLASAEPDLIAGLAAESGALVATTGSPHADGRCCATSTAVARAWPSPIAPASRCLRKQGSRSTET